MKITAVLLLAICLHAYAGSYSQKVTLKGENIPLTEAFSKLEKQSGYFFIYSKSVLKGIKPVDVHIENSSLSTALDSLFSKLPLAYSFEGKLVVIKPKYVPSGIVADFLASVPITGTIKDANGIPLGGINITIRGTSRGTISDSKGNFTLDAKPGDILVLTAVGYQNTEITVTGSGDINVRMELKVNEMTEVSVVVNTGYQALPQERSAGSFAKPDMAVVRNRSSTPNVISRLDGLVPGLAFNFAPTADIVSTGNLANGVVQTDNSVLIRGLTSMYSRRAPLYVVDGIAFDNITSLNPQDVADITVLKDATAASIWGSRAANGVIIITTKRGSSSDKITVNYDGYMNLQGRPDFSYNKMLSSSQFIQAARETFDPVVNQYSIITRSKDANLYSFGDLHPDLQPHERFLYDEYYGRISSAEAQRGLDSLSSINNLGQFEDLWTRPASIMNHTLSVSGGGKVYSFYGSFAFTDTKNNTPENTNQQYKVNLRQDIRFNDRIQFYLIADLTSENTSSKRPFPLRRDQNYATLLPYQLFKDGAGNSLSMPYLVTISDSLRQIVEANSRIDLSYKPVDEMNYGSTENKSFLGRLTAGLKVGLVKGLTYDNTVGYIRGSGRTNILDKKESYLVRQEIASFTTYNPLSGTPIYYLSPNFQPGSMYTTNNLQQAEWTIRNQLNYDRGWNGNKHHINAVAGQEARKTLITTDASTVRGYNEVMQTGALLDYIALAAPQYASDPFPTLESYSGLPANYLKQTTLDDRVSSYYAMLGYTYNRKYILNGTWRIDRSNLFGKDKSAQDRPVWSAGVKWRASEEEFLAGKLKSIGIDLLVLRATYGITGNSPATGTASSSDIIVTYGPDPSSVGGDIYYISTPANRKLTWELTKNVNLGLDFAFANSRITGSLEYYNKLTTGAIGQVPGTSLTSYGTYVGNYGDLRNKGLELGLNASVIEGRDFQWALNFNFGYNSSKITKLGREFTATSISSGFFAQGYAPGALFAFEYAGLDEMGDPQIRLSDKTITKSPGLRNSLPLEDIKYMGTIIAPWKGGLTNILRYKGFGFITTLVYNLGHVMRTNPNTFFSDRLLKNVPVEFANRWKNPGDEARTNVPAYVASITASSARRSMDYYTLADINVADASFIKMRDITLTYSLPRGFIQKIRASDITFRVQVSNIMLWKANDLGIDPEFQDLGFGAIGSNTGKNPYIPNTQFRYPTGQKTITFGLHATF